MNERKKRETKQKEIIFIISNFAAYQISRSILRKRNSSQDTNYILFLGPLLHFVIALPPSSTRRVSSLLFSCKHFLFPSIFI